MGRGARHETSLRGEQLEPGKSFVQSLCEDCRWCEVDSAGIFSSVDDKLTMTGQALFSAEGLGARSLLALGCYSIGWLGGGLIAGPALCGAAGAIMYCAVRAIGTSRRGSEKMVEM